MRFNVLNFSLCILIIVSLNVILPLIGIPVNHIGAFFIGITSGLMFPFYRFE
jgi:hypothetical protein